MSSFPIHLELLERMLSPTGLAFMVRAKLKGARFKPMAAYTVRAGRFVGLIDFEEPVGPERQDGLAVMLGVAPRDGDG